MICNNNLYTQLSSSFNWVVSGNAVIDGENKCDAFGVEVFDNAAIDAVAFLHATGNGVIDTST